MPPHRTADVKTEKKRKHLNATPHGPLRPSTSPPGITVVKGNTKGCFSLMTLALNLRDYQWK